MSGCVMFLTNLLKKINLGFEFDYISVSSYGHETTSSNIKIKKDLDINAEGYDVLIVEDLIDTGNTLAWIKKHLASKNCFSVKICCLLDKKERRSPNCDINIDYVGFECPNEFVVGYGMDYKDKYRFVPFIGAMDTTKF